MEDITIIQDNRPTRSDAVKNRDLLLCTAHRLFTEHGVENVTMSAIAEAAEVGKGTLYRHFPSKADICYALLDGAQRYLQQAAFDRLREFPNQPQENLIWFLNAVLDFVESHLELLSTSSVMNVVPAMSFRAHDWWRLTIRGLLVNARSTTDVDFAADMLYLMLDPHTLHYLKTIRGLDTARIRDGLSAVALRLTT